MARYRMAKKGTHFSSPGVNISWGVGRDGSDVVEVPKARQTAAFQQRLLAGKIVETDDELTEETGVEDVRSYRLLTGAAAAAHMAIPAGPVTRTVYDPSLGETVEIEIGESRQMSKAMREAVPDEQTTDRTESADAPPVETGSDEPAGAAQAAGSDEPAGSTAETGPDEPEPAPQEVVPAPAAVTTSADVKKVPAKTPTQPAGRSQRLAAKAKTKT